ncbi:unnamed protein product [Caenorhabditis bovis]|uniref:Presenilin n=1 Tax=Caenorhabditis bovis TaxID=2654633 RepID=A0A8S1F826_9PELO|nr:unnamed protein product [Caenorhabditis bovis]
MDVVNSARLMYNELVQSSQLQWTLTSVVINMLLTLTIWIGVFEMKPNEQLTKMYFLGSSDNFTTGNQLADGMLNGAGTIAMLGVVSFIMLTLALFDFRRLVKMWLTLSCLVILYGLSGVTAYEFCFKFVNIEDITYRAISFSFVVVFTAIYGTLGIVAFFFDSPIWLHQFYVISNCSLIAVFYLRAFPRNTPWFVLWGVLFWDAFAVLAPMGPLKRIQEKAADYSNNVIRLLMFTAEPKRKSAGVDEHPIRNGVKELIQLYSRREAQDEDFVKKIRERRLAVNPDSESFKTESPKTPGDELFLTPNDFEVNEEELSTCEEISPPESSNDETAENSDSADDEYESDVEIEELTAADALNDGESMRLGFGDFVFYSLLIGQAATSGSVLATIAAGLGVLQGLLMTLTVFSSSEHTIPALPLSVIFGTMYYFQTLFVANLLFSYQPEL